MYDIPDNEFDDLIKRSLKEPDVPVDPHAWKSMEELLDKGDRKRPVFYFILSGVVVIALLSSLYLYKKGKSTKDSEQISSINNLNDDIEKSKESKLSYPDINSSNAVINIEANNIKINNTTENNIDLKPSDKKSKILLNKNSIQSYTDNKSIISSGNSNSSGLTSIHINNIEFVSNDTTEKYSNEINIDLNDKDNKAITFQSDIEKDSLTEALMMLPIEDSVNVKSDSEKKENNVKRTDPIRLSLNFLIGPDFSTTDDFSFSRSGFNSGLLLEIYFSKRISLVTGGLLGKKIYTSEGYDYRSSENVWSDSTRPENIRANCSTLDIPINLRYKLLIKEKYDLFISTGISSYFMLREKYYFSYESSQSNLPGSYEVKNENKHLFKVYNISFGYERYINQVWSIQIEPYIKLPLSGIGEGKIKLISTGVALSLKYF